MLFLVAFAGAAIIALLLWRAMNTERADIPSAPRRPATGHARPRTSGPDDDPEFLRQLDEKVKRRDDPPAV
ncbi:hypothetical protein [Pseudonocardia acidicola]|uniref:Secreted protein n=1 Tax=Pseudonocardia acidicola TaxID=2724939 RepID=A0ABX1SGV6_9PSEU|nr:hypothetical protein [Pseudonocardia acidicola]NMH99708.1 hypothetical protein [Pseudonocardia acidicola]